MVAPAADLAHIDRTIRKEPHYQHQVKYALLIFGPEAKFKVWLALDGDVLYVDKNGDGDLTAPEKRFPKEKGKDGEQVREFKVGDITVGTQVYKNLSVNMEKLSHLPAVIMVIEEQNLGFQKLKAADPDPWRYLVRVEVPVGQPITKLSGQYVEHAALNDVNGFLQFADRSGDAPVIHFGGPWKVWPSGVARFVAGRLDEFDARIGTPGHGPGTFAMSYYFGRPQLGEFVPKTIKVVVEAQFHDKDGGTISRRYLIEDRC
jgi:hypothetical protein